MNKIQTSIEHIKEQIKYAKDKLIAAEAKVECLEEILERLEIIEMSKSIPHIEPLQEILNVVNLEPNGTIITNK